MALLKGIDAHIPAVLKDPLLVMSCSAPHVGNCQTVFVGIVDDNYTHEMWVSHKERLCLLFEITDSECMCDIKIGSIGSKVVDSQRLGKQITDAMKQINSTHTKILRIVGLGVASALVVTEALESLVKGWEISPEEKAVQFIALGESPNYNYLNICKSLCMKGMCKNLQYYNTMDFNDFGYFRSNNICDVGNVEQQMEMLQKMMEPLRRMQGGQDI